MIKKYILGLFLFVNLFLGNAVFGQTAGDYRSNVNTSGVWTASGSWEYYDGSTWGAAANYPGQIAGTGAVLIQEGDVITIGTTGIITETMGVLTISGSLVLTGTNTGGTGTNFVFNTQTIIVTPLLGTIEFINKVNLKLPTNATLQVKYDLTPTPDYYGLIGDCNHNQDIVIGSSTYAYCNGGGSTGLTFYEVMSGGGTLNSAPSSNSPICYGETLMLYGSYIGPVGSGIAYSWSITNPNNIVTTTTIQNPTINNAISGIYTVTLTCSTVYGSVAYSNSETITVTVNPLPTITGTLNVCIGSTTILTGSATANATTPWASSETSVATVSSSGVVTGVAAGTSVITYMNSNGCTKTATITVASLVNNVGSGFSSSSFCAGNQATITFDANNLSGVYPYTLVYRNDTTNATTSVIIANDDATAFNVVPNPTSTTDYTLLSITDSNGCVRTSGFGDSTARVTISALPTAPAVGTITHPTCALATGSVVLSGLPSGNWTIHPGAIAGNTTSTTISGLATGTYNFTVTNASGCTSLASANVGINAQPATPTAPAVSITQPTCTLSTGTISVTVQDIGETYSFDNGVTFQPGNSKSGLASGNYDVIIKSNGGCDSPATTATISTLVTKTWNGVAWSPAGPPTNNDIVIIDANYNTSSNGGDINACSLTINTGFTLTINEGKFVIIQNDLTVNGILEVLDKGSLVMVEDTGIVTNNGVTSIHRFTTPFKKYDYTYWSTPVVSTNIASTFSGWNTGYSYEYIPANFSDGNADGLDDDGNDWSFASTMTPGNGYIIMVPTPVSGPSINNPSEVVFSGKVNNGIQKITNVIPDSSYLLGNPYPSALDAEAFLDYNAGVLDGTLYFWTHNTAIQAANSNNTSLGTGAFAFTSDDYASYNAVGGVGVGSGTAASTGGTIPDGKIASGQGFFASSKVVISGANEIVFNNAMRLSLGGGTLDNSQFFKTRNPKEKTTSTIQKNRVWLNLTNTQGAFKQTLIGYVTNATNDYDSRFDGESFDGNEFVDFYSINQDKNLAIQGRALPFDENDEVPLGFRTTINGTFSINIDQVDGLLANQQVFIEDKLTNTISDLKSGNYTFTTAPGTFNDRFVLRYKENTSDKILSVDETKGKDGIIVLYSNNYKTLIIRNNLPDAIVNSVVLFNMLGQKITHWDIKERDQTSIQIPIKNVIPEIYIVKVKTTEGETSKRIIIR